MTVRNDPQVNLLDEQSGGTNGGSSVRNTSADQEPVVYQTPKRNDQDDAVHPSLTPTRPIEKSPGGWTLFAKKRAARPLRINEDLPIVQEVPTVVSQPRIREAPRINTVSAVLESVPIDISTNTQSR